MTHKSVDRYHEIDSIRSIALILLIAYHIFTCYKPTAAEARLIGFDKHLTDYLFVSDFFAVWRTAVLFVISGIAIGFLLDRRSVLELLGDRLLRLVPPLVFCSFFISPIVPALFNIYNGEPIEYIASPWHLWFVKNLVLYTFLLLPLILLFKERPDNGALGVLRAGLPWTVPAILAAPLLVETILTEPARFAFYPDRFWYGFICFTAGFIFFRIGPRFWATSRQLCPAMLAVAFVLYLSRLYLNDIGWTDATFWTTPIESACWMLAVIGYGSRWLNRPNPIVAYLNGVVFPVYIIHMAVLQALTFVIFAWGLSAELTFLIHCALTLIISLGIYEAVIRPTPWLHPLFGVRLAGKPVRAARPHGAEARSLLGKFVTYYLLTPFILVASVV